MTGALLLVGFAVEGFTILQLHRLLYLHFLLGLVLIGPVLLKIGSTMYRFARYYTGALPYVGKGPPTAKAMRVLGPLVILTSVAVLGTGVVLAVVGRGGPWLFLHKASFVIWFGVMTVHVLNYLPRLPGMLTAQSGGGSRGAAVALHPDTAPASLCPGGAVRSGLLLVASLAIGVGVAAVTMHMSSYWGFSL